MTNLQIDEGDHWKANTQQIMIHLFFKYFCPWSQCNKDIPITEKDDKMESAGNVQKGEVNAFTGGRSQENAKKH